MAGSFEGKGEYVDEVRAFVRVIHMSPAPLPPIPLPPGEWGEMSKIRLVLEGHLLAHVGGFVAELSPEFETFLGA